MVKINMMCGKRNFGKGWIHVDGQRLEHVVDRDIYLRKYPELIADVIYCSHGIAYFDRVEVIPLLKAWHRVLKPGGILRIATPDWDTLRTFAFPMLGPLYGKMNEPPIYHKTVYNYYELSNLLRECGFNFVTKYDHTKTDHAQYDDHSAAYHNGQLISLNVECNARHR